MENIHILYKKLGETPNETILGWKKEHPEWEEKTMTYAGRLDPMAEGLLLVLSGSALQTKEEYLHLPKTYEFEFLWGFETDTYDLLGRVVEVESKKLQVESEDIQKELEKSLGKFVQSYPPYSSKPVSGKPLFKWAREGRLSQIEIPKHEVEIFAATYLGRRTLTGEELLKQIEEKMTLVKGDFRQEEILKIWKDILTLKQKETFVVDKIQLKVSSGFYIRQFVKDLGEKFGTSATTFHIKRTEVGDFKI